MRMHRILKSGAVMLEDSRMMHVIGIQFTGRKATKSTLVFTLSFIEADGSYCLDFHSLLGIIHLVIKNCFICF